MLNDRENVNEIGKSEQIIRIKLAVVKTIRMDPIPALELWQSTALSEKHGLHQLAALAAHLLYLPKGEKKTKHATTLS